MIRIVWTDIRELFHDRTIEDWEPLLDPYRRGLAAGYRQGKDRARSLAAGLLLRYSLASEAGEGHEALWIRLGADLLADKLTEEGKGAAIKPEYRIDPGGKPWLDCERMGMDPPLYFSLSHSGDYVACAISDEVIGLDIQVDKPGVDHARLFRKLRAYEEKAGLRQEMDWSGRSCPDRDRFWELWTCKEACGKLTGHGLAGGLAVRVEDTREYVWKQARPEGRFFGAVCLYARGREE